MQATILRYGDCPLCGYRNQGVQVGTARPGMRQLRMEPGSLVFLPWECKECGGPMHPDLYTVWKLDRETTAKLKGWQERQRAKRRRAA